MDTLDSQLHYSQHQEQHQVKMDGKYLTELNQRLRKGVTAHLTPEGRIYYQNHVTKSSSWLPPIYCWDAGDRSLPYGWEIAQDPEGKIYFINHLNKTTTYEDPRKDDDEPPPQPREVELFRHPKLGFGFVAGSEKPVIVRSVEEGGPSDEKLLPGDQILKVNGRDMVRAPREEVIEMVKSCKHSVRLTVCQPYFNNSANRKSALLTAAKKAKLKSNPSRVRFAEGVAINGSPLYCPTPFESCVPFMPNVLKVFLENGQTKTFKYDSSITVQDVLNSLIEKLDIRCSEYYSLCTEHIKAVRRNKLTILDPKDTLSKIAARPGAHNLRCLFRMTFVPKDTNELMSRDPNSFEYLYAQCCNDVVQERFTPELKYEIALRLCALHLHQHALANGLVNSRGKVDLKAVEKEYGLELFVPYTLMETMKRKQIHKHIRHSLKLNRQLCPSGQKYLTIIQSKIHYLSIISELQCYGAKLFSTNIRGSTAESALLISPKYGISHVTRGRQSPPITLAKIEDVTSIKVTKDDDLSFTVEIQLKGSGSSIETSPLHFGMGEKDTEEFTLVLKGYHRMLTGNTEGYKEIPVYWDVGPSWWTDSAPSYLGQHLVKIAPWSYPPSSDPSEMRLVNLSLSPPRYMPSDILPPTSIYSYYPSCTTTTRAHHHLDHNMNNSSSDGDEPSQKNDFPCIISMEMMESQNCQNGSAQSEEIMKRVMEMNKIVADAESYLNGEETSLEKMDNANNDDDTNDPCDHPQLKAADSLLFLTQIDDHNGKEKATAEETTVDDISPCESDTDVESLVTTNGGSPAHVQSTNESCLKQDEEMNGFEYNQSHINSNKVTIPIPGNTGGSSFGLHSPDVIPSLSDTENDLIETLKQLQNPGEYQVPFSETTLYLDHDIIDLTAIPPPKTPDFDSPYAIPYLHTFDESPMPYRDEIDGTKSTREAAQKSLTDFDLIYESLKDMQLYSDTITSNDRETLKSLPQDIDKFIAAVTVPPPITSTSTATNIDEQNYDIGYESKDDCDYLSSLIIPPPPISSPSFTQEQDDIIARFWKATDDVRKVCNERDDSSPRLSCRALHSSSSGDSGYDSIVNSSPFFSSSSSTSNDWSSPHYTEVNYQKFFLPTVEENPRVDRNAYSRVLIDRSNSSATSSSTTSNNNNNTPYLDLISLPNLSLIPSWKRISESSSCDDLYSFSKKKENELPTNGPEDGNDGSLIWRPLVKSHSWTSLQKTNISGTTHGKPPLPPNSTSRFSERRKINPCKKNGIAQREISKDRKDYPKVKRFPLDGGSGPRIEPSCNLDFIYSENFDFTSLPMKGQCFNGGGGGVGSLLSKEKIEDIFIQSQRDIDTLLARLEDCHESRLRSHQMYNPCDIEKYTTAKEALLVESRHFVTATKLFVKCATEASPIMIDHLLACVSLLERMFDIGETVVIHLESQAHITCLVDRLKEVAATYGYTVDTVHKLTDGINSPEEASSSPYMGLLMNHASTLATSLSALMRTLRALN